jgi:hypothetical protein
MIPLPILLVNATFDLAMFYAMFYLFVLFFLVLREIVSQSLFILLIFSLGLYLLRGPINQYIFYYLMFTEASVYQRDLYFLVLDIFTLLFEQVLLFTFSYFSWKKIESNILPYFTSLFLGSTIFQTILFIYPILSELILGQTIRFNMVPFIFFNVIIHGFEISAVCLSAIAIKYLKKDEITLETNESKAPWFKVGCLITIFVFLNYLSIYVLQQYSNQELFTYLFNLLNPMITLFLFVSSYFIGKSINLKSHLIPVIISLLLGSIISNFVFPLSLLSLLSFLTSARSLPMAFNTILGLFSEGLVYFFVSFTAMVIAYLRNKRERNGDYFIRKLKS